MNTLQKSLKYDIESKQDEDTEFSTDTLKVSKKVKMFKCYTCEKQLYNEAQALQDHQSHTGKFISVRVIG